MTHLTVRNSGKGLKTLTNSERRAVNLQPGDERTLDMHPVHAQMLLRAAAKPDAQFEVMIDPDERIEMEQLIAAARKPQKVKTEKRFITDPMPTNGQTSDDDDDPPPPKKTEPTPKKKGAARVPLKTRG